jgi:DNA-binding NarL/FixJ family response regulator
MKAIKIDPEAFVRMWLRGSSRGDIADELGCSVGRVEQYAARLRKLGVKLPKRTPWSTESFDVGVLNRIIEEYGK